LLREEECVLGTGQGPNDAAAKDAQMYLSKEECAKGMGQFQLSMSNYTTVKAQTKFREEGYVGDTGRIASHTMNLQRLGQNSRRLPQLEPHPISVLLELPQEKDRKEVEFLKRLPFFVKILLNGCVVSMPRAFLAV
jgi:hypothetical protein